MLDHHRTPDKRVDTTRRPRDPARYCGFPQYRPDQRVHDHGFFSSSEVFTVQ